MDKHFLFFGFFDPEYARNRILIKGLLENGCEVTLCRVDPQKNGSFKKFWALYKEYRKVQKQKYDHVIVAFPGHTVVWLAYLLFGRKIIFDVFVSLYNSEIEDRLKHSHHSLRALYYWMLDWIGMHLSPRLLIDTKAHRDMLVAKFGISKEKFLVVYVGSDDSVVFPVEKDKGQKIIVHFHGTGTPMQGVGYIIESARLLENNKDIEFRMYGISGSDTQNVHFFDRFPYGDMSSKLAEADIVLGIFGDTEKAQKVIPNKVYEGWAARKPVITGDTQAIIELSKDNEELLFCEAASGEDLAAKILDLKNDNMNRQRIAEAGYSLFLNNLRPRMVVKPLLDSLKY